MSNKHQTKEKRKTILINLSSQPKQQKPHPHIPENHSSQKKRKEKKKTFYDSSFLILIEVN